MNNVNKLEEGQRHKWAQREKGTEVLDIGRAPDENRAKDNLMSGRFVINELFKILGRTDGVQIGINGTTAGLSE